MADERKSLIILSPPGTAAAPLPADRSEDRPGSTGPFRFRSRQAPLFTTSTRRLRASGVWSGVGTSRPFSPMPTASSREPGMA